MTRAHHPSTARHRLAVALCVGTVLCLAAAACSNRSSQAENSATKTAGAPSGIDLPAIGSHEYGKPDVRRAILPNGRLVRPAGTPHDLGDFPLSLAISPDGRYAVAANNGRGTGIAGGKGSFCAERGVANTCGYVPRPLIGDPFRAMPDESLTVTDLRSGKRTELQVTPTKVDIDSKKSKFNFFSLGAQFDAKGTHLYVTGGGNDAVYDFSVGPNGIAANPRVLTLPSKASSSPLPISILEQLKGYTKGLALTPDGRQLLVVKEYDSDLSVLDLSTFTVRQQIQLDTVLALGPLTGYLYGVAVNPDGTEAFVTAQGTGYVHRLRRAGDGTWAADGKLRVGDHPTQAAVTPDGRQLLVANAADDTVAVVDVASFTLADTLHVHAIEGESWGSTPNAIAIDPDGKRAYVALAGDDALGVLDRSGSTWKVSGFVPTGWYPAAVAVRATDHAVLAVAAKGVGSRYLGDYGTPPPPRGGPQAVSDSYYSVDVNMAGLLSVIPRPGPAALTAYSKVVTENIKFVTSELDRPSDSPIPAVGGGSSPIKHVIYVVRENRTFDQVFGDLGSTRKDVDADPSFELLASATPNAHAMQRAGAISDRFFSDGEASIQGHFWTALANANDYVEKSWRQNYSPRGKPYDYIAGIAQAKGCSIFQRTEEKRKADPSFSYTDYGEVVGAQIVNSADGDEISPCTAMPAQYGNKQFATKLSDLSFDDRVRAGWFLDDIGLDDNGNQVGDGSKRLSNFSYVALPQDHTTGLCCKNSPRAQIAQNDAGLGRIVQAVSHSKYWKDTAIFVVEDDSVDGVDHVDGHRNILMVMSPWAKHAATDGTPGYVSHQQFDQPSVLRTMELILGLEPLSAYDQLAAPLYDLCGNVSDPTKLTATDLAPFDAAAPAPFIEESNTAFTGVKKAKLQSWTGRLDFSNGVDRAGALNELLLWASVTDRPAPAALRAAAAEQLAGRAPEPDEDG